MLTPVNARANMTITRLDELAAASGGHTTIDNRAGAFMPLVVEQLPGGRLSLAHYGEQNGDLMRDPEMVFWKAHGTWYPVYYRNDYLGTEQESVQFAPDGTPAKYYRHTQRDHARFAGLWMTNIRRQQGV